jgi:hypothetical protein
MRPRSLRTSAASIDAVFRWAATFHLLKKVCRARSEGRDHRVPRLTLDDPSGFGGRDMYVAPRAKSEGHACRARMEGRACHARGIGMDDPTLRGGRDKRVPPRGGPDKQVPPF